MKRLFFLICFLGLVSIAVAQEKITYEKINDETVKATVTNEVTLNVPELLQRKKAIEQAITQLDANYAEQKAYLQNKLAKIKEILSKVEIPKEPIIE